MIFCNDCYYYEPTDHERGLCHRYPPDNGITKVKSVWWCGDFAEFTYDVPDKTIEAKEIES